MSLILILEDDDDLRDVLVEVLEAHDHKALGVPRGEQAIQLFQECKFDLLVVDIRMAGPDGLETLSYLRQLGFTVPTLVMTGFADQADPVRALRLGAKEYLMKPFALDEFLWAVERILDELRKSEQQSNQQQEFYQALEWTLATWLAGDDLQRCQEWSTRLGLGWVDSLTLLLTAAIHDKLEGQSLPANLPLSLKTALQAWEARWDGQEQIPLSSRLGSLLQALPWPLSEASIGKLQKEHPGRFDPYLLERLVLALKSENSPAKGGGQLLDLIHILLACGDRTSSRKAFEQLLLTIPSPSAERIFAHLGLADAARESGPSEIDSHMLSLLGELQLLPPTEAVGALWKSADWLLRLQRPEIPPLLKSLGGEVNKLGRKTIMAQLALLAWAIEPASVATVSGALQQMMLPENVNTLRAALDWLLPRLLNYPGADAPLQALLTRLCRQEIQTLSCSLREQRLSVEGRVFAAQALVGLGSSANEALNQLAEDPSPRVRELAQQPSKSGTASPENKISVQVMAFGGFELWVGSHKISDAAWRGARVKHVAAYVALSAKPVHSERLLELFWPESKEKGQKGLQSALSVIRGACRDFAEVGGLSILVREAECILFPESFQRWVDCHEFDRLIRLAGQSKELDQRCNLLQRAVALYKGPFLEGCFLDWALALQNNYEQLAMQALLELSAGELTMQRWLSALQTANQALRIDPLHLQAAATVVKSHLGAGNPELAVQFFEGFHGRYQEEFGQSLHMDALLA